MDSQEIDRIVREVVRRLRFMAAADDSPIVAEKSSLTIRDRLITLETLRGKVNEIHELVVLKTAVVTPSVRDDLRDRGIKLVRQTL